mmetsp:Transcript_152762/g.265400  ORF Transcript_152762/g.265400 Transcript_152762/m.265400 type:complete len:362 (-) Transcript_152762:81-1166(-)
MSRRQDKIKKEFRMLDKNGDGQLDFDELKDLLRQGGSFSDDEVQKLYDKCDSNHDGKISFSEFVDYVYGAERTSGGRHARLSATTAVHADASERDWGPVKDVFVAFAGKDMDGREFSKFCADNGLWDRKFKKTDADLIFSKVVPRGQRRMDYNMFKDAVRHIAAKKQCSTGDLQDLISDSEGPVMHGTKADAVRFHDDKTTYTGSHVYNAHHEGTHAEDAFGRHERLAAAHADLAHGGEGEHEWDKSIEVLELFLGRDKSLDGTEFYKMMQDCGIIGGGFLQPHCDVVFSANCGRSRKIDEEGFKACIRGVAKSKGQEVWQVQQMVEQCEGPHSSATKAGYNRFHDDKYAYTGSHVGKHIG